MIKPIRTYYRGIWFRSTLEADWAATFDSLDWYWRYEPEAVQVGDVQYRCDFHLPTQRVWCEVKGPHNERIEKPAIFSRAIGADPWDIDTPLVVILRPPGPGDVAVWEGVPSHGNPEPNILLATCPECQHHCFFDHNGAWQCRRCRSGGKFWNGPGGALYESGQVRFTRAPRQGRKAS